MGRIGWARSAAAAAAWMMVMMRGHGMDVCVCLARVWSSFSVLCTRREEEERVCCVGNAVWL